MLYVFTVSNFDIALSCGEFNCINGGKCKDTQCQCPIGYTGADCGIATSLCEANYCLNGATCKVNSGSLLCICRNGIFFYYFCYYSIFFFESTKSVKTTDTYKFHFSLSRKCSETYNL